MAQFANSFDLLGARDIQQLIVEVDERADATFLEESKRKVEEEERRKKEEEKQKLQLDIQKNLYLGGQRNYNTGFYNRGNRYNQQRDFNSQRFPSGPKSVDARFVSSAASTVSQISSGTVSNGGSGVDSKRNHNGVEKEEPEAVVEKQQEEQGCPEQGGKAPEQVDKTSEQGDKTQLESNGIDGSSSKKSSEGFLRRKINGSVRRKMKKTKSKGGEDGGAANDSSAAAAPTAPDDKKFTPVLTLKEYEKMKKAEKDKPAAVQQPSKSEDQQQQPANRQQQPAYLQQNRPTYHQQHPAYHKNNAGQQPQHPAGQFNRLNGRSWNPEKDRRGQQGFERNCSRQAKPKAPFELDNIAEFPSLK